MTNEVPSEIKKIFRSAFELYQQYLTPPEYMMDADSWYQAGRCLTDALKPFENSDNYEFAKCLLFTVYEDIERRSKTMYEQKNAIAFNAERN